MAIQVVSSVKRLWIQEVTNSYVTDTKAQELLRQLAIKSPNEQGFSVQQGIIRLGDQVLVGANSALRTKLIAAFHSSALGGHSENQKGILLERVESGCGKLYQTMCSLSTGQA